MSEKRGRMCNSGRSFRLPDWDRARDPDTKPGNPERSVLTCPCEFRFSPMTRSRSSAPRGAGKQARNILSSGLSREEMVIVRVYATIEQRTTPVQVAALAQGAEATGFDGFLVADGVHDGPLIADMALRATTRMAVGIGVLVALPRSPMTVAHAA